MSTPAALIISLTAAETSGPIPSPGIKVMVCFIVEEHFMGIAHSCTSERSNSRQGSFPRAPAIGSLATGFLVQWFYRRLSCGREGGFVEVRRFESSVFGSTGDCIFYPLISLCQCFGLRHRLARQHLIPHRGVVYKYRLNHRRLLQIGR
jgi:hypothetical protein